MSVVAALALALLAAEVEPTLSVVEFENYAGYVGLPQRCPGADAGEHEEDAVCFAELYEERAFIVRHLSGPRLPGIIRLRTTAHSARVLFRPGMKLMVATYPFRDGKTLGQFAYWWEAVDDNGRICVNDEMVSDWRMEKSFRFSLEKREVRHDGKVNIEKCISVGLSRSQVP